MTAYSAAAAPAIVTARTNSGRSPAAVTGIVTVALRRPVVCSPKSAGAVVA